MLADRLQLPLTRVIVFLSHAVVIGNQNTLEYWEYKKGEFAQTYKTPEPFTNEISRVVISGSQDKAAVFLA